MKLLIKAKGSAPTTYVIDDEVINGFDLSSFPEGAIFTENEDIKAAGILHVERVSDVLHVTLGQHGAGYECQPVNGSHDWRGTGEWIDAAAYDPNVCYIKAISAPEGAQYEQRENGWTVAMPVTEEELSE